MTTSTYPNEIIGHICGFIDSPADLLAISQASKIFRDIVIPDHLYYREIRCDLQTRSFWETLAQNKRLISQVRCFAMVPKEDYLLTRGDYWKETPILPPLPQHESHFSVGEGGNDGAEESDMIMQAIAGALACMPLLQRFRWHTLIRPATQIFSSLYESCPKLKDVEVLNWDTGAISTPDPSLGSCKLWSLSNLTRFSYSAHYSRFDHDIYKEYATQLADMLLRCSNLEDLQLLSNMGHYNLDVPDDDPLVMIFETFWCQWPKLRRLSIDGEYLVYNQSFFLPSHPALEAICIYNCPDANLEFHNLPNLHSLEVDWVLEAVQINPYGVPHLNHLDIKLPEYDDLFENVARDSILSSAYNLSSLVLRSENFCKDSIEYLIKYAPKGLQRLAIVLDWPAFPGLDPTDKELFTKIFKQLTSLTHFSPVYLDLWSQRDKFGYGGPSQRDRLDRVEEGLHALVELAPALRFVGTKLVEEDTGLGPPRWVMLERKDDGKFDGFTEVTGRRYQRDIDPDLWGDLYRGAGKEVMHVDMDLSF